MIGDILFPFDVKDRVGELVERLAFSRLFALLLLAFGAFEIFAAQRSAVGVERPRNRERVAADMRPTARLKVDDANHGAFSGVGGNVPLDRAELLVVVPFGVKNRLGGAVVVKDRKFDALSFAAPAAPDEERQLARVELEDGRLDHADRVVRRIVVRGGFERREVVFAALVVLAAARVKFEVARADRLRVRALDDRPPVEFARLKVEDQRILSIAQSRERQRQKDAEKNPRYTRQSETKTTTIHLTAPARFSTCAPSTPTRPALSIYCPILSSALQDLKAAICERSRVNFFTRLFFGRQRNATLPLTVGLVRVKNVHEGFLRRRRR